jgi:NTP pyrophosphatase (non-canonical NTP hydrolase)
MVEEELADVVIRIMDYAFGHDFDVAGAILAKIEYNKSREFMHGKAF